MEIPKNSVALYRIMTEKSIIGFGKYGDMRIGDILKVDPSYIAWAYYNRSMISFKDNILEMLGCEKIVKPGVDEVGWKKYQKKYFEGLTQEEINVKLLHFRVCGKRVQKAKLVNVERSTRYTREQLQAINHGHGNPKKL